MDSQLIYNIKKIYKGIIIYNIVGIIILFIIKKASLATIGGLVCGSVVSMISLFMLAKNIVNLVEKDKTKATFSAVFGYVIRLGLYAVILVFAALNENINLYTVAFGLISTSLVIKIQAIYSKYKK